MRRNNGLRKSLIASAIVAAFSPLAAAQGDEEIAQLTRPQSEISAGVGYVDSDNQRFGQYNGLTDSDAYLLLDADVARRDDATGTWLRFRGREVGFDNRLLRFEHERQGNWRYFIEFDQTPRFEPFTVRSGLLGVGTTTQTVTPVAAGTGAEYRLKTERQAVTLGMEKALARGLGLQVRVRNEEKDGARLWGQGYPFPTARFLTDPIDQNTLQLDATLNYATGPLQLSGGYYGTSFENRNNLVTVVGCPTVSSPGCDQMALPPDNQSHQLHLAGGYDITKTTRAHFKAAYGRITQDEAFATTPVAGAPGNLDGRIDTTLLQAGIASRIVPRLMVRADLRYENRDDKTTIFRYYPSQNTPTSTNDGTNEARDVKTTSGKLDADYRLPMNLTLGAGVEYVEKKRNSPPVRAVGYREKTDETSLRAELRRPIGETATGSVAVIHSERRGSDFLINVLNNGVTLYRNLIAPLHLADRDRDTVRLKLSWLPVEPLSLQFRADVSRDNYSGRGIGGFDLGPREGEGRNFSLDAGYSFSDAWQATAWYSRNENRYENATCRSSTTPDVCNSATTPAATAPVWGADQRNISDAVGFGLEAKPWARLKLGADVTASKVRDKFGLFSIVPAVSDASVPLPDINTKVTTVKLTARYALQRNSGVRLVYAHDRYQTDDWTWANWVYTDGTTIRQEPKQTVNFVGASYYYQF